MYIDLVYRASLRKPLKQLTKKKNTKDDYGQWPNLMVAQLLLKKPKWKYLYQSCCTLWQVAIMGCLLSSCIFLSAFVICPGFSDVHQSRHPCQATVHVDSVACKMKLVWLGWCNYITQTTCVWGGDSYADFLLIFDFLIWFSLERSKESSVRQGKFPCTPKSD